MFKIYRLNSWDEWLQENAETHADSLLRMRIMKKTSIAISARGIEINFVFNLLKTTSIAVET